jgi:SAM-dependent methyltransferase
MTLRQTWHEAAEAWAEFASSPDHDFLFWAFHRRAFLELLPPPGRLTVDLGAGEGRMTDALIETGHRVVALDASPAMARLAARRPALQGRVVVGDASAAPLPPGVADLVVAFTSLQDMDRVEEAVADAARLLQERGRFCLAIPHPLRSAGRFESKDPGSPFVIAGSYFARRPWPWRHSHSGTTVAIPSEHRAVQVYTQALERAGLLVESLREPAPDPEVVASRPNLLRWTRLPCFLHVRAVKLRG